MPSPGVFGPTRIRFSGEDGEFDERQAAVRVATVAGTVELRAGEAVSDHLPVTLAEPGVDTDRLSRGELVSARGLEFLQPKNGLNILVLAAGQAYKLSPTAAEHLVRTFRLIPSVSGGGGPADDVWATQLNLPPDWLSGCGLVWMLGRPDGSGMRLPMRSGNEWNTASLVEV